MFGSLRAQCFEKVQYNIIQKQNAIELIFDSKYDNVIVNLENTNITGNIVFESSIELKNIYAGERYLVFRNLAPSKYLIQLVFDECKWVIGGIEGIIISNEDEK